MPWMFVQKSNLKQVQQKGFGGGKGGGWGKGGQGAKGGAGGKQSSPPKPLPKNFKVNSNVRYQGKVSMYKRLRGFGFIECSTKGKIPEDKVFVHWENLVSTDRFPTLVEGMDVEFSIKKETKNSGVETLGAVNVTLPGGGEISVQDEIDAEKKEFVGGQFLRYTGTLKFYFADRRYGYITLDDGFELPEDVGKEIRVEHAEVNCGGKQPSDMKDVQVEFGIWKAKKGYKAYNMTLQGGGIIDLNTLENRKVFEGKVLSGHVEMYFASKSYGYVKAANPGAFPPQVKQGLLQAKKEKEAKGKTVEDHQLLHFKRSDLRDGVQVAKGQKVQFKVYTGDKGPGACDIH